MVIANSRSEYSGGTFGLEFEVSDKLDELSRDSDLVVLEVGPDDDPEDYRHVSMAMSCPILCMTSAEKVSETVGWLLAKDDVCLSSSPPSIVAARLSKLRYSQLYQLDPLTGVQRREALFAFLQSWSISPTDDPLSLVLADIDEFKSLNERLGREQGDQVLQRLGILLREECDHHPVLARMSGQEFAIVQLESEQTSHEFAEHLRHQIEKQQLCAEADVNVSSVWHQSAMRKVLEIYTISLTKRFSLPKERDVIRSCHTVILRATPCCGAKIQT